MCFIESQGVGEARRLLLTLLIGLGRLSLVSSLQVERSDVNEGSDWKQQHFPKCNNATESATTQMGLSWRRETDEQRREERWKWWLRATTSASSPPTIWAPPVFSSIVISNDAALPDPLKATQPWLLLLLLFWTLFIDVHRCPPHCTMEETES